MYSNQLNRQDTIQQKIALIIQDGLIEQNDYNLTVQETVTMTSQRLQIRVHSAGTKLSSDNTKINFILPLHSNFD